MISLNSSPPARKCQREIPVFFIQYVLQGDIVAQGPDRNGDAEFSEHGNKAVSVELFKHGSWVDIFLSIEAGLLIDFSLGTRIL